MNFFPSFVVDKRKFYARNSTHLFLVVPNSTGIGKRIRVNSNSIPILLIGLCIGITLGVALIPLFEFDCDAIFATTHGVDSNKQNVKPKSFHNMENNFQQSQAEASLQTSQSQTSNVQLRPRFYSTELGLRKKLVAGIILTDYTRPDILLAINKTLGHFMNKILFFVVGQETSQAVRNLGLGGVVTLTSKRNDFGKSSKLNVSQYSRVGLRAIKYLGEKLSDDYDFYYLSLDKYYTNGVILQESLNQISVSVDLFWGANSETCSLETGLIFSRSILRKLSSRLDRCLSSSVLKQGADPMRNCYAFSLGSIECSGTLQTHAQLTTSSMDFSMFSSPISIGPVTSCSEIYRIHLMITEKRAEKIDEKITNLSGIMDGIFLQDHESYQRNSYWPFGIPIHHRPQSRFDVLKWKFFTQTSLYPKNDHETEMSLLTGGIEQLHISSVINNSAVFLGRIHEQNADSFSFQYGYGRFDETRGHEYIFDFLNTDGTILRVESLRPISKVEMVQMPFVTEIGRVTIVVPITSLDLYNETDAFIKSYLNSVEKKSNSVLVFAIPLSDPRTLSVEESIKLQNFKRMISRHNSDLHNGSDPRVMESGVKVGHVTVNLKQFKVSHNMFAIFDMLSNHILSPNTLVLVADLFVGIKEEFLNRVRMNTILNYQIFSPIPFVEYDPKVYGRDENNNQQFEISKSTGYFDRNSFNFVSFYVGDYLRARKQILSRGLSMLSTKTDSGVWRLSQLFLSPFDGSSPHFLRAPEPTLILRFGDNLHQNCSQDVRCLKRKWGSKVELAKLILQSSAHPTDNKTL